MTEYIIKILPNMISGLGVSAEIFFFTIILSLPLGILLALVRISQIGVFRKLAEAYIYLMRGTPLMLQILFIYYGLPLIPGLEIQLGDFSSAIIAFVANYAAYFAEIFRGGIQSINRGQYEGSKVLGFTYKQTMWYIVLPQVIKRVLPPLGNETITLLKDTSLVYILAMNDFNASNTFVGTTRRRHYPIFSGSCFLFNMYFCFNTYVELYGKALCCI